MDISKLPPLEPKDRQELEQFQQAEAQKNAIQGVMHNLNTICFPKCVTTSSSSGSGLSSKEESCLRNCVDRFLDAHDMVLKSINSQNSRV